ncbi:MAG: hypothetical protein ABJN26_17385 [Stappiaceae bacterium]
MSVITAIPLTLIPFAIFNAMIFGFTSFSGQDPLAAQVLQLTMVSGVTWVMTVADVFIAGGLVCLFIEILKATRPGAGTVIDHMLSLLVFIAYLIEFIAIKGAAHSVFFLLGLIALIDVVAGFTISIHGARRDVAFGSGDRF